LILEVLPQPVSAAPLLFDDVLRLQHTTADQIGIRIHIVQDPFRDRALQDVIAVARDQFHPDRDLLRREEEEVVAEIVREEMVAAGEEEAQVIAAIVVVIGVEAGAEAEVGNADVVEGEDVKLCVGFGICISWQSVGVLGWVENTVVTT